MSLHSLVFSLLNPYSVNPQAFLQRLFLGHGYGVETAVYVVGFACAACPE